MTRSFWSVQGRLAPGSRDVGAALVLQALDSLVSTVASEVSGVLVLQHQQQHQAAVQRLQSLLKPLKTPMSPAPSAPPMHQPPLLPWKLLFKLP